VVADFMTAAFDVNANNIVASSATSTNVLAVNRITTRDDLALALDTSGKGLSNVGSLYLNASHTIYANRFAASQDPGAVPSPSVTFVPAVRITGSDPTLLGGCNITGTYGATMNTTQIGLRVDNNILGQAFLSVSDRRIKTDILQSSASNDLATLLNIPVVRYNFIEGSEGRSGHPTIGFIAQDVEIHAPFAVRTTVGTIPNIMRTPLSFMENGRVLELPNHALSAGAMIKVIVSKELNVGEDDDDSDSSIDGDFDRIGTNGTLSREINVKVVDVIGPNHIRLGAPIKGSHIFVYGQVVSDFKLLDNERIMPIVFNATKELHAQHVALKHTVDALTLQLRAMQEALDARLTALERGQV
jgi:hypothetical protein